MNLWPWRKSAPEKRPAAVADSWRRETDLSLNRKLVIEPQFAQRFNAYAAACFPNEIGAVVRIVERGSALVAVDFQVLEQEVSPTYFEFTTEGQARFQMEMATSGRGQELAEWNGLIHSHPNMTPFMSGTDVANLWKLAGTGWGLSLICSAHPDPEQNYFSVNYAQGGPVPLMVKGLAHNSSDQLSGIGALGPEQLAAIEAEVQALTRPRVFGWKGSEYVPSPSPNRPVATPLWFEEDPLTGDFDPEQISILATALEIGEDLGSLNADQSDQILSRIEAEEELSSSQADQLLTALGEYPLTTDEWEQETVQDLINILSERLDNSR